MYIVVKELSEPVTSHKAPNPCKGKKPVQLVGCEEGRI